MRQKKPADGTWKLPSAEDAPAVWAVLFQQQFGTVAATPFMWSKMGAGTWQTNGILG